MIFYLTFNDAPSGIYSSQVIDVVNFIHTQLNVKIRLVAFISIRGFLVNKKIIKQQSPEAIVLPMFPKLKHWQKNQLFFNLICKIHKPTLVIGRSVLATQLAFGAKNKKLVNKIIYDGRGAIEAEWKEYKVIADELLLKEIHNLESECIHQSNYRIAVSNQLIKHWLKGYSYQKNDHVVIPCTLNQVFEKAIVSEEMIAKTRRQLAIHSDDILLVYSGSLAGWQSFELLETFLSSLLNAQDNIKVLFLSKKDDKIAQLEVKFPLRIFSKHVGPIEVPNYLIAADYGLLIREETITNQVASPVKYAEYLACGLKVLISDHLGDYSDFTKDNRAGYLYTAITNLPNVSLGEKLRLQQLALKTFSKSNYQFSYQHLIE